MEAFGFLENFGSTAAGYVVPFLFVLTLVVFVHEFGHFLVARWCGVGVKVFSIGFGPELFGFNDRKGTRWRISLIPLGGYVKFIGDENEASQDRPRRARRDERGANAVGFAAKGVGARAIIVAAGPMANFVLAIVIFAAIFSFYGRQVTTPRVDRWLPAALPSTPASSPATSSFESTASRSATFPTCSGSSASVRMCP